MAVQKDSGTCTPAGLDIETTIATRTDGLNYVLALKVDAMQSGDIIVLREYDKILSSDVNLSLIARTVIEFDDLEDVTHEGTITLPLASAHECRYSLEQTDGSVRSFPWSLRAL